MYGQGPVQGFYSQDEVTIANYTVKDQVTVNDTSILNQKYRSFIKRCIVDVGRFLHQTPA